MSEGPAPDSVFLYSLEIPHAKHAVRKRFLGTWRIVSATEWDTDYLDLSGPAELSITTSGYGTIHFGAFDAILDAMTDELRPEDAMQFSFMGEDEGDEVCGRGYAVEADGVLHGRICFHRGMVSDFTAEKIIKPPAAKKAGSRKKKA